jgi:hypothetical protein
VRKSVYRDFELRDLKRRKEKEIKKLSNSNTLFWVFKICGI